PATSPGATTRRTRPAAYSAWCSGPMARRSRLPPKRCAATRERSCEVEPMVGYYRPDTLTEALALRASRDLTVLGGGTDVYPARAARAGWGEMAHKDVLDITALKELKGIVEEEAYWRFGALTTWTELIEADLPPAFAGYQL